MDFLALNMPDLGGTVESVKNAISSQGMNAWGLAIVAFFAGLAVARGIVSQMLMMVTLAISVMAGLFVFQHRTDVFGAYASNMTTNTLLGLSGAAAVLTYFLVRGLVNFVAGFGIISLLASFTGWKAGLLSLVPSGVVVWLGAMVMRLLGSVYSLENANVELQGKGVKSEFGQWISEMAQKIDRTSVGSFVEKLDPYDMRARANLARLLILWPDGRVWQQLASRGQDTANALNHPEIAALGQDAKVRQAIERQDFAGLMQLPQVARAAANPQLEPFLKTLVLEEAMDTVVYKAR
ncbi:hypothetical protein [Brevifollis gellanilyticus]|uniref:Uncharacterized protein n=1 Tax=Brevifollis gellanilyticus TaxID=748831 RepID=A0A512M9D3_9BACT|nr:hypothetical protein [Brevifollis gellanilyticus]GEP43354.1 hypothetical protein BGE01nite_26450 [Brevifollis gellanilyticus]